MIANLRGSVILTFLVLLLMACPNPTSSEKDKEITLIAIPGVAAPVTGAIPITSIDTSQYTGSISWSPEVSSAFAPSTEYTATINLTPKNDYTLKGVSANSFTIEGATSVTHAENSGILTVAFPRTLFTLSMVSISGGSFNNGTANMTVSSFRMSTLEITGDQYSAVMGADPSYYYYMPNHPAERVNWYQAITFCNKLSIYEGLIPPYSVSVSGVPVNWETITFSDIPTFGNADWDAVSCDWNANGYRLPTEAEWEFAARGGNNTQGYTYSGSDVIDDVAWYKDNSIGTPHQSGAKSANELGFFDMSGNVSEWCWDWNGVYPVADQSNYTGSTTGFSRAIRGGSWKDTGTDCAVATRSSFSPMYQHDMVGFRVARR